MKITFETETYSGSWVSQETHRVLVDGVEEMSQSEGIEPEDARFSRDLSSPHDCDGIIRKVIEAVKRGEEIEIEYTDVED